MEKVWKAEQKHEAERKKIEELQRELLGGEGPGDAALRGGCRGCQVSKALGPFGLGLSWCVGEVQACACIVQLLHNDWIRE